MFALNRGMEPQETPIIVRLPHSQDNMQRPVPINYVKKSPADAGSRANRAGPGRAGLVLAPAASRK